MIRSGSDGSFVFLCPTCDESLEVNRQMRDTLLEEGCVICEAPVSTTAFSAEEPTERR